MNQLGQGSLPFDSTSTPVVSTQPASGKIAAKRSPDLDSFTRGDAWQFLESLPDESVDLVITDPPYESLELHRSKGTTTRLVGQWFHTVPNAELPRLLREVHRVLKNDRHFYLFCDEVTADIIKEQQGISSQRDNDGARTCKCGLRYWREIVWAKTTRDGSKIYGGMGYHYRSSCERIMFFEKGKRRLNDLGVPDVLLAPRPEHKAPAGKPFEVTQTLVTQSANTGEVVVDPFAGSGVVALAALKNGRRFWINDLDDSYLLDDVRSHARVLSTPAAFAHPITTDPEAFVAALVAAAEHGTALNPDEMHDSALLGFTDAAGKLLIDKLMGTRPLERPALVRRHVRSLPWMHAARTARPDADAPPGLRDWLKWLEG